MWRSDVDPKPDKNPLPPLRCLLGVGRGFMVRIVRVSQDEGRPLRANENESWLGLVSVEGSAILGLGGHFGMMSEVVSQLLAFGRCHAGTNGVPQSFLD